MAQGSSNVGGHGASLRSWLTCFVMLAGFIVGGVALVVWNWPMFWAGVAIFVIGAILAGLGGIMDDVTEYGGGGAGHDPGSATY